MAKRLQNDQQNPSPFTLIEEATSLIRRTPLTAWLGYFAGTGPFIVYLFYFWSDMSRSANAAGRLLESSLILSALYGWMKFWHAVFCGEMMRVLEGHRKAEKMPARGWIRLAASQVLVHASMPWILILSAAALLPLAWVYAFYHNVSVLAVGHFRNGGRTKGLLNEALRQSHYLPTQNHLLLIVIFCVALLVYLNFLSSLATAFLLSKSFTGIENAFSMNPMLFLSSSFQSLLICLSYLVMNPLIKALYVLRCFYGVSRRTGADIEARIRMLPAVATKMLLLVLIFFTSTSGSYAQEQPSPLRTPVVVENREVLEQSIKDVLQGSEFQWRLPREDGSEATKNEDSWLGALIRGFVDWLKGCADAMKSFLDKFFDWLFRRDRPNSTNTSEDGNTGWLSVLPTILIVLVGALLLLLGWMIYRHWTRNKKKAVVVMQEAPPEINLEAETVLATQMPENEWLKLAREKANAGELRLALRALFLATLAHLGEKRLLTIVRSKSNGDYVQELSWRARGNVDLYDGFKEQVRMFDHVWYGWHEVSSDLMAKFEEQHERITQHAT